MVTQPDLAQLPQPALIIGDARIERASGGSYRHIYAATGQPTGDIPLAGAAEIDRAVAAARAATPDWAAMAGDRRRDMLFRLAQLVEADADRLARLSVIDNSIPIGVARYGPYTAADSLRYNAGWADKIGGDLISTWPVPALDYAIEEPYGVVAVIIPWNGPVYALGMVLGPVLAAGNTIVVKPPELAPYACQRFAELCLEAGIPPGVVNMVAGGPEAGHALTGHRGVDKIHFTGSGTTAQHILTTAAPNMTPVQLELGGKSASIVFADADLDAFTPYGLTGIINNSGQGCINPTRLLVQAGIYDEVVDRLESIAGQLAIGDPFVETSMMGPVVDERAMKRILGMIDRARSDGARLVTGGNRMGGALANGYFVAPTIFCDVPHQAELSQTEVFGPVLAITRFERDEDAIAMANDTAFGLAAYVWTRDLRRAHLAARQLISGNVWVNGFAGIPTSAPFGGVRASGYGRLGGRYGIREFTRPKNVWINLQ